MIESRMRTKVVKHLRHLHAFAVENRVLPGTPDVSYIGGWIELKQIPKWPSDEHAVVKVPHFTPRQRAWLRMHHSRGGVCWVLLKCKQEWLLFDGQKAACHLGNVGKPELVGLATMYWPRGLKADEFRELMESASDQR